MLQSMTGSGVGYVSLDDPIFLASAVEQGNTFLKDNPPPVFIDEVQKAPELFPQIKLLIDRERKKGHFYLCGSQQFCMMKNVSESLVGRLGMLTLLSLSMRELTGCDFNEPFLPDDAYYSQRRANLPTVMLTGGFRS